MLYAFTNFIRGYVRIRVEGNYIEKFLNRLMYKKIYLWDIQKKDGYIELNISISDFFSIKKVIRNTKSRIKIIKKIGIPFFLNKLVKRKSFIIGLILFYIVLVLLTSLIWSIEIIGTERINNEDILKSLRDDKIVIGSFKNNISLESVRNNLYNKFEDIIWVSVSLKGTHMSINIVESTDKTIEIPSDIPCDIVSDKNAIIYKIATSKGTPKVKEKDVVKKNDILVSGVIDIDKNGEIIKKYVHSNADIKGKSYIYIYSEQELKLKRKRYTGNVKNEYDLIVFGKKIKLIKSKEKFKRYTEVKKDNSFNVLNTYFGLDLIKRELKEYIVIERKVSIKEGKNNIMKKINEYLSKEIKQDMEVLKIIPNYYVKGDKLLADVVIPIIGNIGVKKNIENIY